MSENISGKTAATYVLASSIFALAIALLFFTVQIGTLSTHIPEILGSVERTSEKIEPVVKEIDQIRDLIPPILTEVQKTRDQIPLILEEVRLAREQIPSVLSEVAKSREQLPAILDTANNVSNAVVVAAGEMEKTRPLVPQVLDQVEKTRNAMPGIMDRAEDLISQAKTAGREASKGAVTGVLTGIVTAPFDIIGNVGKKVIGAGEEEDNVLPEEDLALATKSVMSLLDSNKLNAYKEWADSKTNHRGRATLKSIDEVSDEYNGQECKDVFVQVWEGDESIFEKLVTLCRNDKNEWIRKK